MAKLLVFNQVSLDGYFAGVDGDISWAHKPRDDAEWNEFVAHNAGSGGLLVFGRITYEMMASYWPTPQALENDRAIAEGINQLPKVVFSKTLDKASWNNTKLLKGSLAAEIRKLKQESEADMVILGSGSIVSQLTTEGLIDGYSIVVNPIVLGKGRTMFEGVEQQRTLTLSNTRVFRNGNVLMSYEASTKS